MIDPQKIKTENIALIKSWGILTIDHLPTLESETELNTPSAHDVARRCIILTYVVGIGFDADATELNDAIKTWGLASDASAQERDLLGRTTHTDQERIDAEWLEECLQALAWCFSLAELKPFEYCDESLSSIFPDPFTDPSEFIASATLRPFEEIYRQADLHYRLHWAARHALRTGIDFPASESLIRERRKALDWVIGVERDWDEVPSNT